MDPRPAELYPLAEAHAQGYLPEADGHRVYWEASGNPDGLPVVLLHGGPGSGASPVHRGFFDPVRYRIVQYDQRGCGRSTPRGGLNHNTARELVEDLERLRIHLGIPRWLVVGGSWGAALALAYAGSHRAACLGLILRGTFLTGRRDLEWFCTGAGALLPDAHQAFLAGIPRSRWRDPLGWFEKTLKGPDPAAAPEAVRHWMAWEDALTRPGLAPLDLPALGPEEAPARLDKYCLQVHYLQRRCFLGEARLLDAAARLQGLPCLILHGRLDLVCRPENAWRVHRTLHGSHLAWVAGAGHNPFDGPMVRTMLAATDHFALEGRFDGFFPGGEPPPA